MLSEFLFFAALALGGPLGRRSEAGPVMPNVFPDPALIRSGNAWIAFGTSGNGHNIQVAESPDFASWTLDSGIDAMPSLPGWVDTASPNVWAPDVIQVADGSFVLYFSASSASDGTKHCVGAATSKSVKGPYQPLAQPLACPLSQGGAIDASGINDGGQFYVTYKVDGNSIGHGGECGNAVAPYVATPIMLQKMAGDGITAQGDPVQILDNAGASDEGIVEAPSMLKRAGGGYVLFFSSGCYSGSRYTVSYATAASLTGPYTRQGALLQAGSYGTSSPGGADVDADGVHMVFHAGPVSGRQLYTAQIAVSGDKVTV